MAKAGAFTSRARAQRRDIVTPEGMPVPVFLAARSQRAGALFLDLLFMLIALIVIGLIAASIFSFGDEPGLGASFYLLISFVLRNFYFIVFELYWRGATPGKRIMGLRVIDRGGGRLKADAIFARNLMREVEIFMPLSLLFSGATVGSEAWVMVLTLAWVSIFTLLPLFNRERLRAGDMVGGTWVVSVPKKRLRQDLAEGRAGTTAWQRLQSEKYQFSQAQLEAYGIFELQTLETVLRHDGEGGAATRRTVAERIQRKIGWESIDAPNSKDFLDAYYQALRAHLEKRMLMGKRRENKHDK